MENDWTGKKGYDLVVHTELSLSLSLSLSRRSMCMGLSVQCHNFVIWQLMKAENKIVGVFETLSL